MTETIDVVCDVEEIQADKGQAITTLSSHEIYRNKWLRVREDLLVRPNGQTGIEDDA